MLDTNIIIIIEIVETKRQAAKLEFKSKISFLPLSVFLIEENLSLAIKVSIIVYAVNIKATIAGIIEIPILTMCFNCKKTSVLTIYINRDNMDEINNGIILSVKKFFHP